MAHDVISTCPVCSGELAVTRLRCGSCGTTLEGEFSVSAANDHRQLGLTVIDADERIPLKDLEYANQTSFATQRGYGGSISSTVSARVPRADLPERWQGYPTWTILVIAASDDLALTAEQRSAIATWAAAGGLVVVAQPAQREAWRKLGIEPLLLRSAEQAIRQRLDDLGAGEQPTLVTVPGTESVPATGFMLLATLFALVVGPLNLWWVRRRGTPALFLVTTPLLSLGTCVVLLGANVVIEGLSLRRVASQLTVLDQQQARAIAWTRATYYGGFSVARFDVDSDAEVRIFEPSQDHDRYYRGGWRRDAPETRRIDWRGGQHLAGEWIPARRNRQLLYAVARAERAQLQLARSGDGWRITNGLDVAIRELTWRDGAGVVYSCGAIPFGASAELTKGGEELPIPPEFGASATNAARVADQPWGFSAALEGSFGALPGPAGVDAKPVTSYVVGRLNPENAP